MNLCDARTVRHLLKTNGIIPRRHWGQNFLVSRALLTHLIAAAGITREDTVLEIGAGLGALTVELAKRAKRVLAIERDPKLCAILQETLASFPTIDLLCEDARTFDIARHIPSTIRYKLVANLPYGVGTIILRKLLEGQRPPTECIVILQREVAERIAAKPPRLSLLGIAFQDLAEPEILSRIPKDAMWPIPAVESAILRLRIKSDRPSATEHERLLTIARLGFRHPRKYVLNNLSRDPRIRASLQKKCGVEERSRSQELTLEQWRCLATNLSECYTQKR
jgi:16S rRNA (adenine1518-N6/adenine1519-N6)-dimethyltransferase